MSSRHLQLYLTTESPCGYFADRMSSNLVPDPQVALNMYLYNQLIQHGFRRSGAHCYRPHCKACQACIACRIPVNEFITSRSQQRCLKKNSDLTTRLVKAGFSDEYFELYNRYLHARHADGSMANPASTDFQQFLYCSWSDTQFLEVRLHRKLVAVAVTDMVSDGASAVYSFFDPAMAERGLGNYCILSQISQVKQRGMDYLYLGYWIENHPKMHYKTAFRPLQLYLDEHWQRKN